MIENFSKDEIKRLSTEQQELIGKLALDDFREHRSLLTRAKQYQGMHAVPVILCIAALLIWNWKHDLIEALPYFLMGFWLLIQFHARGINSRIDAILILLDLEKSKEKRASERGGRSDLPSDL